MVNQQKAENQRLKVALDRPDFARFAGGKYQRCHGNAADGQKFGCNLGSSTQVCQPLPSTAHETESSAHCRRRPDERRGRGRAEVERLRKRVEDRWSRERSLRKLWMQKDAKAIKGPCHFLSRRCGAGRCRDVF